MSTSMTTTSTYPTSMASSPPSLYYSLLRPPILSILRAAGFHSTRPSVLDTLVDITARYLALLATRTAAQAEIPCAPPTISDVRLAMQECGALRPQRSVEEEWAWDDGEEDVRGVEAFVEWVLGDGNREIRRVAGLRDANNAAAAAAAIGTTTNSRGETATGKVDAVHQAEELLQGGGREDFLTALKKKHSKSGEESRLQGTVLGKSLEDRPVRIEGGSAGSIGEWSIVQSRHSLARAEVAAEAAALERSKTREDHRAGQQDESKDEVMAEK